MPKLPSGEPDERGRVHLTVRLKEKIYRRTVNRALEEGVPINTLVEKMLDLYVEEIEIVARKKEKSSERRRVVGGNT